MSAIQQLITNHLNIWTSAEAEKKSGRGRSSGNGDTVYGIKKLRELILELAVRGKLVPQDPKDEPASELLKRIQAEKANKKNRMEFQCAPIADNEVVYQLPVGWECVRFGAISEIERGGSPRPIKDYITEDSDGFNWIKIGDTDQGGKYITSANEKIRKEGLSKTRMVYPGDFLLTNSMSFGRPYITKIQGCIHDGWLRISPPDALDKDYLYCLLSSPYAYKNFKEAAAGAVVFNLNADKVRELPILLPPFPEQHRIVAKVDELMALCDQLETQHNDATDAHEKLVGHLLGTLTQSRDAADFNASWQRIAEHFDTLFTTEHSIDTLKQTLLQLAVMGKLVPQDPNDEPASELLKRIQTEKAKLIAAGKVKKEKPLPPISDEEKPFELPIGWGCGRLGELLEIVGGVTLGRKNLGTDTVELPYLRVANVQRWRLDLDSIKTVEIKSDEIQKYKLEVDDLLVTEGGDWDKVGRTAIWRGEIENCLHQNHIFRMRIFGRALSSSWVELYMNTAAKQYFQSAAKQTTNLASINMSQLKCCVLGVPSINEQSRIIAKVNEFMSLCDQLKSRITDSARLKQKLADALVEQALAV